MTGPYDTPWSVDALVRLPARPGEGPVPEDPTGSAGADAEPDRVLGSEADEVAVGSLSGAGDTVEPLAPPSWAEKAYAPRVAPAPTAPSMRRFGGGRTTPSACVSHIIGGVENRTVYWPSGYPWHCIGKLLVWDDANAPTHQRVGSGALVGARTVLTASHVFPWASGNWKIQFVPAFYDGSSILGASSVSWVQTARGYNPHKVGNDMAVLKLFTPLGTSLGALGAKVYDSAWEDLGVFTLCGYPCDLTGAYRPTYQTGIPVTDDDSEGDALEIENRADEASGMSGGPFFGWWDDPVRPYAVGTHHGWEEETIGPLHSVAAGGKALVNLVNWARQNWP